jgi:hypothetical protein
MAIDEDDREDIADGSPQEISASLSLSVSFDGK